MHRGLCRSTLRRTWTCPITRVPFRPTRLVEVAPRSERLSRWNKSPTERSRVSVGHQSRKRAAEPGVGSKIRKTRVTFGFYSTPQGRNGAREAAWISQTRW